MLTAIKVAHTVVWALFVANRWRCALTDLAARYTDDRRANFDIYLPLWLAANNKRIFGSIFAVGVVFAIWRLAH